MAEAPWKRKEGGLLSEQEAMDFDLKPRVLCGQKEVDEYLATYGIRLPSKIEVKWCSPKTDITVSPPITGVYFRTQSLVLRVKLLMTPFVRDVLARFKVPPSQWTPGTWRTVFSVLLLPLLHTRWRNFAPST